jgi:FkbM family methyltransferase
VSQWKSDFPESWFVETNELIHFANPISKLGDFYINDSIRSRFEHVLSLISKNLVDEKSKNLLDMIFDLRCGGSEHSFFKLMLEMNLVFRTKYESFTKKRSYDLIIDGGIFDGNEIQIFREMLEDHGQYRGFEPNSDLISAKNREILEADNRLIIHNFALWDKCETLRFNSSLGAASNIIGDLNRSIESVKEISAVTLDEMFEGVSGKRVLIKLDIEGAEMNALRGGANFFQRNNVDFAISIYHKANDLMEIPEFILNLEKNYAYSFGVSNPTFVDWVFYAIEKRED